MSNSGVGPNPDYVPDIEINADVIRRNRHRMDYFIPAYLIHRIQPGQTVCSAGCGSGYDVELLYQLGVDVWGFDRGARTLLWKDRPAAVQERLRFGYADDRPFADKQFDFVYALEVIEHVGCEDSYWMLQPDALEVRQRFLENCLDMLKPGGRLFLSTSNRLCPLDIGHGHHYHPVTDLLVRCLRIPLTIPWHPRNFVLSRGDIARLLAASRYDGRVQIHLPPVRGYLSFSKVKNSLVQFLINQYLFIIDVPALRPSFLNPLLVVEIEKTGIA